MTRVPLIEERDHPELAELIQKVRGGRQVRRKAGNLYPADVRIAADQSEFRAGLAEADGLFIESLPFPARKSNASSARS